MSRYDTDADPFEPEDDSGLWFKDYDYRECAAIAGVKDEYVVEVLAGYKGENSGPFCQFILKMRDGRQAWLRGWRDFTGWGCRDHGEVYYEAAPFILTDRILALLRLRMEEELIRNQSAFPEVFPEAVL